MVRWLNKDLLEIHIEANQHLNRMMKNVHEKSEMIVQGKHHIHNLLNKVSKLRIMDFEDTDEEKYENEMNDLFGQINEQTDEVEEYRDALVKKGKEIINLYFGENNGVLLHSIAAKVLRIIKALKALLRPFCQPLFFFFFFFFVKSHAKNSCN